MEQLFERIPKERQGAVLGAAMNEFTTNGYRAASTNAIVRRLGVSKGILFKYFATKEALFRAVVEWAAARVAREIGPELEELPEDPVERVIAIARAELALYVRSPELYRFFRRTLAEDADPVVQSVRAERDDASRAMFAELMRGSGWSGEDASKRLEIAVWVLEALARRWFFGADADGTSAADPAWQDAYLDEVRAYLEIVLT